MLLTVRGKTRVGAVQAVKGGRLTVAWAAAPNPSCPAL